MLLRIEGLQKWTVVYTVDMHVSDTKRLTLAKWVATVPDGI